MAEASSNTTSLPIENMASAMEATNPRASHKYCVLIPAYQEQNHIAEVLRKALSHTPDVIVIDDGSTDRTVEEAQGAGATVLRMPSNCGKGIALNSGFAHARAQKFDYVITMDADGQHDPDDIPRFVEAYVRTGIPVLVGNRMANPGPMPLIRRLTNRFMSRLLSRQMGQFMPDTQCGYRLYRCDVIPFVSAESERFAAESEILLHVADRGIRIDSVPIASIYRDETSQINPVRDTARFFSMLRRFQRTRKARQSPKLKKTDVQFQETPGGKIQRGG